MSKYLEALSKAADMNDRYQRSRFVEKEKEEEEELSDIPYEELDFNPNEKVEAIPNRPTAQPKEEETFLGSVQSFAEEKAKAFSVGTNDALHSILDTMSHRVSRDNKHMQEGTDFVKENGVDEYIKKTRREWAKKSGKEFDEDSIASDYEREMVMNQIPTMFQEETKALGNFVEGVFKNMSERTIPNEVVEGWRAENEARAKSRSGGGMNPFDDDVKLSDAFHNATTAVVGGAPIMAVTAINPVAGAATMYSMNNKSFRDKATKAGLTDDEMQKYEMEASTYSTALGYAEQALLLNKIPHVEKVLNKIGSTVVGKSMGLLGKAGFSGSLEWGEEDAIPNYFLGKALKEKGLSDKEVEKHAKIGNMLESPSFWLGSASQGGMDLGRGFVNMFNTTKPTEPIAPDGSESIMLEEAEQRVLNSPDNEMVIYDGPIYSKIKQNMLEEAQLQIEGQKAIGMDETGLANYEPVTASQIPRQKLDEGQGAIEGQTQVSSSVDRVNDMLEEAHQRFLLETSDKLETMSNEDKETAFRLDPSVNPNTMMNKYDEIPASIIESINKFDEKNTYIAETTFDIERMDSELKDIEELLKDAKQSDHAQDAIGLIKTKRKLEADKKQAEEELTRILAPDNTPLADKPKKIQKSVAAFEAGGKTALEDRIDALEKTSKSDDKIKSLSAKPIGNKRTAKKAKKKADEEMIGVEESRDKSTEDFVEADDRVKAEKKETDDRATKVKDGSRFGEEVIAEPKKELSGRRKRAEAKGEFKAKAKRDKISKRKARKEAEAEAKAKSEAKEKAQDRAQTVRDEISEYESESNLKDTSEMSVADMRAELGLPKGDKTPKRTLRRKVRAIRKSESQRSASERSTVPETSINPKPEPEVVSNKEETATEQRETVSESVNEKEIEPREENLTEERSVNKGVDDEVKSPNRVKPVVAKKEGETVFGEPSTETKPKSTQRDRALKGTTVDSKGVFKKTETVTHKQSLSRDESTSKVAKKAGVTEGKSEAQSIAKRSDSLVRAINELHIDIRNDKRLLSIQGRNIKTESQLKKAQDDVSKRIQELDRGAKIKREATTEEKSLKGSNKSFKDAVDKLTNRVLEGDEKISNIESAMRMWNDTVSKLDKDVLKSLNIKPLNISSSMSQKAIEAKLEGRVGQLKRAVNTHNKKSVKTAIKNTLEHAGKSDVGDKRLAGMKDKIKEISDSIITEGNKAISNAIKKAKEGKRLTRSEKRIVEGVANGKKALDDMTAQEMKQYQAKLQQFVDGKIDYEKMLRTEDRLQKEASAKLASIEFEKVKKAGGHKDMGTVESELTDGERIFESIFGEGSTTVDKTYGAKLDADMHEHRMNEKSDTVYEDHWGFIESSAVKGFLKGVKDKVGNLVKNVKAEYGPTMHDVMTNPTITFGKQKITVAQALDLYATSKTEGGAATLANSGWSKSDIDSAIGQIPKKFKDSADKHASYLGDTVYNHVNDTHVRVHGTTMGKSGYYHPITNVKQATSGPMSTTELKGMYDANGKIVDDFTKSRAEENAGFESIDDLNYFHKIASYEQNANRYTSQMETMENISAILTDKAVRDQISSLSKGDDNVGKAVDKWLEHQISGRMADNTNSAMMDKALRWKNKYITSVFSNNPWIPIKQVLSAPIAMAHFDAEGQFDFAKAIYSKEAHQFARDNSDLVKFRNSSKGLVYDIGVESKKYEKSIDSKLKRGVSLEQAIEQELAEAMTGGITYIDQRTVEAVWYAGYKTGMRKFDGNKTLAKKYADRVVRKTQPKYENRDIPSISRNKVISLFRSFTGPTTQILNTIFDLRHAKARNIGLATGAGSIVAMAVSAIGNAVIDDSRRMVRHHAEDTKAGRNKRRADAGMHLSGTDIIKAVHGQLTRNVVFLEGVINEGIDGVTGEYNPHGGEIVLDPTQGYSKAAKALGEGVNAIRGDASREEIMSVFKSLSVATGYIKGTPVGTTLSTINDVKGLFRILKGKIAPDSVAGKNLRHSEALFKKHMRKRSRKK
tara:strand:+ start:2591 stop:8578 length:5988 start_codon:yes stop_codon:yes gene_type:complete